MAVGTLTAFRRISGCNLRATVYRNALLRNIVIGAAAGLEHALEPVPRKSPYQVLDRPGPTDRGPRRPTRFHAQPDGALCGRGNLRILRFGASLQPDMQRARQASQGAPLD